MNIVNAVNIVNAASLDMPWLICWRAHWSRRMILQFEQYSRVSRHYEVTARPVEHDASRIHGIHGIHDIHGIHAFTAFAAR